MTQENDLAKRRGKEPTGSGESDRDQAKKPDPLEEAKRKIAEDVGAFVTYMDSFAKESLGMDLASGVRIYDQVMQARAMDSFDPVDAPLRKHLQRYSGRIELVPFSFYYRGAEILYRINDLGIINLELRRGATNLAIRTNGERVFRNAEMGDGDAPFSHAELRYYSPTKEPSRYVGGNYYMRVSMEMLAGGAAKDGKGRIVDTVIPMQMMGENGAIKYRVSYDFLPGTGGEKFVLQPDTLIVQNTNIRIAVLTTESGLVISVANSPEIPSFVLPHNIDILSSLKKRFDLTLGGGDR